MSITRNEAVAHVERILTNVRREVAEGEQVLPTATVVKGREVTLLALDIHDEKSKQYCIAAVREHCRRERPDFIATVLEAWKVMIPHNEIPWRKGHGSRVDGVEVMHHPDRVEGISVIVEFRDSGAVAVSAAGTITVLQVEAMISRDGGRRRLEEPKWVWADANHYATGLFTGMLAGAPIPHPPIARPGR